MLNFIGLANIAAELKVLEIETEKIKNKQLDDGWVYYKFKRNKFYGLCGRETVYSKSGFIYFTDISLIPTYCKIAKSDYSGNQVKLWLIPEYAESITKEEYEQNVQV